MIFLRLLSRLPFAVWYALAGLLGALAFNLLRYRDAVADGNLQRAFPERDARALAQIKRAYRRNICDLAAEAVKALTLDRRALLERVSLEGLEALRADLGQSRSVILATAHCANWEWLLLAVSATLDAPMDVLYKPIKSGPTERFFRALRSRFGAHLIPAKDVMRELGAHRGQARVLAMAADQVPASTTHRYWTRFLNQDTAFYLGLEDLARATGWPVYVMFAERVARGRYRARCTLLGRPGAEELGPREIARRYAAALEAHLTAHPADWLWGHRRWKLKKPLYGR